MADDRIDLAPLPIVRVRSREVGEAVRVTDANRAAVSFAWGEIKRCRAQELAVTADALREAMRLSLATHHG